jgi:hypothetical protein
MTGLLNWNPTVFPVHLFSFDGVSPDFTKRLKIIDLSLSHPLFTATARRLACHLR